MVPNRQWAYCQTIVDFLSSEHFEKKKLYEIELQALHLETIVWNLAFRPFTDVRCKRSWYSLRLFSDCEKLCLNKSALQHYLKNVVLFKVVLFQYFAVYPEGLYEKTFEN